MLLRRGQKLRHPVRHIVHVFAEDGNFTVDVPGFEGGGFPQAFLGVPLGEVSHGLRDTVPEGGFMADKRISYVRHRVKENRARQKENQQGGKQPPKQHTVLDVQFHKVHSIRSVQFP